MVPQRVDGNESTCTVKGNMTFSENTLLYVLDRNPELVYSEIKMKQCEPAALAVCLCYGKGLPQGREWGTREQRRLWLDSERAKKIRRTCAVLAIQAVQSEKELMKLYREIRKKRGYGPLVKFLIKGWREFNYCSRMEVA